MRPEVFILGTRGSAPVNGKSFSCYGGSTTCVFLRLDGQQILLDAGTGMMDLPQVLEKEERQFSVLLSHPHVDHLLGLPMCGIAFDPANTVDVYAAQRNGNGAREQVTALLSPPLWPVSPEQLPAKFRFFDLSPELTLGHVTVETMEGIHPGGVTLYRLTGEGKTVVFVTDCTLTENILPAVTDFARNCDLLLCDGQYSLEEWPLRKHFGHNTWIAAAQLGASCGAKQVRIMHHDPARADEELDRAAAELKLIHNNCSFAYAGERLFL